MVYDNELKRGIHKKYLPEPNPQRPRNATLQDVFKKAKQLIFRIDSMCLADSGGIFISVLDKESWLLSSFYQKNRLQPSRYKLYVAVREEVSSTTLHTNVLVPPFFKLHVNISFLYF